MDMNKRIEAALKAVGITIWRITEVQEQSAELFFVKKQLDTRRSKDTLKYKVAVFREEEKDGKPMKGSTEVTLLPSVSDEQMKKALADAYFAAQFALNPGCRQPKAEQEPFIASKTKLSATGLEEACGIMAQAAFRADCHKASYINSFEIFAYRSAQHIWSSEGTDVSWDSTWMDGEYVVQCKKPEDVELFYLFAYDDLEPDTLYQKMKASLDHVYDRAAAEPIVKTGTYDVILADDDLSTLFQFQGQRSNAQAVVAGYSTWKIGDDVQHKEEEGEALSLTLKSHVPFSFDGIRMKELQMMKDGKLAGYWGNNRFCQYIGIEPTGYYDTLSVDNPGTMTLDDMKKQVEITGRPILLPVLFSDFNIDPFSGNFGGEIRLGYLYDGKSVRPFTGCAMNGNILEAQKTIRFSKERHKKYTTNVAFGDQCYEGPYAALLQNISVMGK